jgi:lambda family phage portal protein
MEYNEEFIIRMAESLRERRVERRQQLAAKNSAGYPAADVSRITYDWPTQITSPTAVLRSSLTAMRSRSRQLAIGNDYARRFLSMVSNNIVGPDGIALQCKAKWPDGRLDNQANDIIEDAYYDWGEKGNYEVTGMLSMIEADRTGIQSDARDGEFLIRFIEGFDNKWGFALQFYEVDHLDESLNVSRLPNGNQIRMGVEIDRWFRPVAYHLLTDHPGDSVWMYNRRQYIRLEARDVLHPFIRDRFNQPRGVPWMHSAMTRLQNIGAYEESAIMAARIGASKMGFYELDDFADAGAATGTNPAATTTDEQGRPISEVEPGLMEQLPKGWKVNFADWKYPDGEFAPFMKASLRGIASGLLVSYNALASDLEGVNFSSIRAGVLEERDCWKILQAWWIENVKKPVYRRWLRWQLLNNRLGPMMKPLPVSKLDKFLDVKWQPRTWPWVDPETDNNAKVIALKNKLTSWTKALAEDGIDLEEHLLELKTEQELAAKYGVELKVEDNKPAPPAGNNDNKPEPDDDDDSEKKKPPVNFSLTVNGAPVNVAAPEVRNEITVQPAAPAAVQVAPAAVNVENKIEVQPAAVTAPVVVNTPEMKVENYTTVAPAAAPAVTVNTPEVKVENRIEVPAAAVSVENRVEPTPVTVVNKLPRPERKKRKMTMLNADGTVRGMVTEE